MPLGDRDSREDDWAVEGVVELVRLATPAGVITSRAFGTVFGSAVQCGSALAVAQTPNWNACGVGGEAARLVGLKPSWPGEDDREAPAGAGRARATPSGR